MKILEKILLRPLLLVTVAALGGCVTENYQQGADTAANLQQSADAINVGKEQIKTTLAALSGLVNSPQGDLVPKLKTFGDALDSLEGTAAKVKSSYEAMRDGGNAYLQAWDEQLATISNQDIKARSTEGKQEIQQKFTDIKRSYIEASIAFSPFMRDLNDVYTALSTNLTSGGINAVKATATKLNESGTELVTQFEALATQFRDLGVSMAAVMPAPAPGN